MPEATFTKNIPTKSLTIEKYFAAPRENVWAAWTDGTQLEQWWGPEGWPAKTSSFSFKVNGHWHYSMTGPDGTQAWSKVTYTAIDAPSSFAAMDQFCDAAGVANSALPTTSWHVSFIEFDHRTLVTIILTFGTEADLEKILEMGFETGFRNSLSNLDRYLQRP